jgi:small subunit ribosomal protein S5
MNVVLPLGRTLNFTSLRTFATTTPMFYPRLRSNGTPQQRVLPPSLLPPAASYTSEHIEELKKNFTPEQLSALLIGEQAIDPEDFKQRAERRSGDPFALGYLDDLTKLDPLLDFPEHMNRTGKDGFKAWLQPLPKINDPKLCFKDEDQEGDTLRALSQHTGMPVTDLKNIRCRTMVVHSVTNQTRMGKIRKMYVLAVAGNGNGLLGIGEGKSAESEDAIRQASYMAIRNMEPIPRYEKRTIYGDVEVKQGAVEMKIFTRPPGVDISFRLSVSRFSG